MHKVLITASVYSHIANFHQPYLKWFREQGWQVHIGCAGAPKQAPYAQQTLALPFQKRMWSLSNLKAAAMLRSQIRREGYELIITHTSLAAFFTRLAVKGMADRPRLVNMVHGYLFDDRTPALKRHLLLGAERLTVPETDLLLTMNRWDDALARKHRLGSRVLRVPGVGVDFARLDRATAQDGAALRSRLDIGRDRTVLIYAAEFSRRKSQSVLIHAMSALPEQVVLVLCGEGETRAACQTLAQKLGLAQRVFFPGQEGDMSPWYRMADICVSASRSEGLPFHIMEAMHMGLPVVASAVKGNSDLITDGKTGLLYPYGDADACAQRVRTLLSTPALGKRLAESARREAEQYNLRLVFEQVSGAYRSMMREGGTPE